MPHCAIYIYIYIYIFHNIVPHTLLSPWIFLSFTKFPSHFVYIYIYIYHNTVPHTLLSPWIFLSFTKFPSHFVCIYIYIYHNTVPHTLLSPWIFLSFTKSPFHFVSGTMLHFHTELLTLHSSCRQPHSALEETSPCHNSLLSMNLAHTHLIPALTTASHSSPPVTKICKLSYCFHSIT